MKWSSKETVHKNAREVLPALAQEYLAAGSVLCNGSKSPEDLHTFRLRTKHFRYTLELFEGVYDSRFAQLLRRLKPLQDALGEINDAATALHWLKPEDPAELENWLTERIKRKSAQFEKHWNTVFNKPGEAERWIKVLGATSADAGGKGSPHRRSRAGRAPENA